MVCVMSSYLNDHVSYNFSVLFSVLVLHWVTHQDEDGFESSESRCGECKRTLGGARYSFNNSGIASGRFGQDNSRHQKSFGGQVVTNCEANKGSYTKSIPLGGIMTRTEFTRDVESMDEVSDAGPSDKRESSIDRIRELEEIATTRI